jgi:hypothetical protein
VGLDSDYRNGDIVPEQGETGGSGGENVLPRFAAQLEGEMELDCDGRNGLKVKGMFM